MKHRIDLVDDGEQFLCGEDSHLLQGMRSYRPGLPLLDSIPVGCRGGGCGVCRVRVRGGDYETLKMSHKHITKEDEAQEIVLACRVFPRSNLIVSVADAQPVGEL